MVFYAGRRVTNPEINITRAWAITCYSEAIQLLIIMQIRFWHHAHIRSSLRATAIRVVFKSGRIVARERFSLLSDRIYGGRISVCPSRQKSFISVAYIGLDL